MSNRLAPTVFICLPHKGKYEDLPEQIRHSFENPEQASYFFRAGMKGTHPVALMNYNRMWAAALDETIGGGTTHLAMVHDDVYLHQGWLDILWNEKKRLNLDLISAVVPIADERGVTSTAVDTGNEWNPRRYTMTEVSKKPRTWTEPGLIVNNGCMLMSFEAEWIRNLFWEVKNRVFKMPNGRHRAEFISEDWNLSREIWKGGGRVGATTAVQLYHREPQYHNHHAWGTWETEQEGDYHGMV